MNRSPFHIAVLEDSLADLFLIEQAIKEVVNCRITSLRDGAEALALIANSASPVPDLMILDLNVPRIEGPSVLNSIRANTKWSQVAVLVFSSSSHPADIARVMALGADQYLVKPMDLAGFSHFGQKVKQLLEKESISV